ncbi:MAG: RluA family pseudouridine synthase, partial [Lachnospiraceae bacterium]|nr:RluA family pseudouridine synthase [Lachnospiraceae bacterium]
NEFDYYKGIDYKIDVIYEDDDIIACNKPAGLLSQKSKDNDISINEYIVSYLIKEKGYSLEEYRTFHPSVSNRLDYNTTGVILAAKTLKGQQNLSHALKYHELEKYYICICVGEVKEEITLSAQLSKDTDNNKVTISDNRDGNIMTKIFPIRSNSDISLLKIQLLTGKTHQIRAHLAHIGHPIIGDMKYGYKEVNELYRQKYGIITQALHSYTTYYDNKNITAPLPDALQRLIEEEYGNVEL